MQDETQRRRRIIEALHHGVVPAIGCTEPVSLALAAARAARLVGGVVEQVEVRASANLVKNAMAVTVPGTDLPGPAIAAALGAVCGGPEAGLEVLGRVASGDVEQARALVGAGRVDVQLADGDELLRAEVTVHAGGRSARVCIAGGHTQVVQTMAGDTVGMVCDGASPGCALKVSSAVSSAHGAVVLGLQGQRPAGTCGLVFDRVEDTIEGLGRMAG
ncbi:hypothetical protein GCM10027030_17640 [Luteococcus sediminum]